MFDDPKKELERLEKQLLEDEEWFQRELDSAKRMIGQMPEKPRRTAAPRTSQTAKPTAKSAPVRNYANGYGQEKRQSLQVQDEAPMPRKGVAGLLILLSCELLGILGLAAYWFLVLLK